MSADIKQLKELRIIINKKKQSEKFYAVIEKGFKRSSQKYPSSYKSRKIKGRPLLIRMSS
jgi:hypothetical protein